MLTQTDYWPVWLKRIDIVFYLIYLVDKYCITSLKNCLQVQIGYLNLSKKLSANNALIEKKKII